MARNGRQSTAFSLCAAALGAALALGLATPAGPPQQAAAAEHYKLPISPPLDQGDSDLCWVYAALSMLESNYLSKHPNSTILLSRAVLQRHSIADRFKRHITGNSSHLEDGGLSVDALTLIRQNGVVGAQDFHGVVNSHPVFADISRRLAQVQGADDKLKALDDAMTRDLGAAPGVGQLDGKTLTPQQFAKAVLGDGVWSEYDVTRSDSAPQVGPSDDPDARPETRVRFVELPTAIALIHDSLRRGEAVVWGSTDNHALLIYGADYDANGRPLDYWIKDSFAPYTYRAAAEAIHKTLTDVTVTAPRPRTQFGESNERASPHSSGS